MRAGEFVAEIGDSPAAHEPNRRRKRSLFHATVDGHWVDVFFDRSDLNGTLHITFTVNDNYEAPEQPTSASKSTVRILSTVLDIIKRRLPEYMRSARPPAVSFTAKEDSRTRLYRKYFVPVVQSILGPKWELNEYPTMGMTVFNWRPAKQDRTGINEIGAPGELDVSEKLQRYFTDRGYDIAGEGRDQMVFHKPGQRHVVKVIGLGDDLARRDNVADYVRFFALNQRNPHFPRVSQPREIRIGDEIYTIYRQELLQGLPGEEEVMDWMEKFGAALSNPGRARAWVRENPPPASLPRQQVQGLYAAVRRLQQFYGDDLGGTIKLDLGHTGNFMQRADGTIVVVDPLAYDESYDTYSESAPVANEDIAGTVRKGLAGAALAGTMAMGSPATAAEPPPMTTVAVVTIDGETRQYNLGTRFQSSREALQFVDGVLKRQGLSGYDINIRRGVAKTNENATVKSKTFYHATYRPLLKSIRSQGLGGSAAQAKWEDSEPGVVYLARDPEVARSYAETSDMVPEEWLDDIVILAIDASRLDSRKLRRDRNVQDDDSTLEYHGVIKDFTLTENFADGRVKGKSRPGRVKRAGASCKGSVTDLRARARKYGGERGKMYHWCANMKGGKKK